MERTSLDITQDLIQKLNDNSEAFISIDSFKVTRRSITARITIFVNEKGGMRKKQVTAELGDDLYRLSRGLDIYKDRYIINELDTFIGYIEFSNGKIVYKGQAS
jgi:type III restriction enzyme